jgi:hypothetical protein
MEKAAGRVLKGSDVNLEGTFRLDIGRGAAGPANEKNSAPAAVQVRVIENNSDYALIEVTCGCGEKTQVKCEYANAQFVQQE